MKQYITEFFTHSGCALHHQGDVLSIELTPELTQHFGRSTLQLVFDPAHVTKQTELVTYGSYITTRMYDWLKHNGKRIAIVLPKKEPAEGSLRRVIDGRQKAKIREQEGDIHPYLCAVRKCHSREVRRTETFLTFRITYYSNEKFEELITIRIDDDGNLRKNPVFPYSLAALHDARTQKLPYTKKEARIVYERCLVEVQTYAEDQAQKHQHSLAEHYHQDILRLEGYYQQMIEEIPDLAIDRESQTTQFQQEFERKAAEELKRCQVHVQIEPVNFCTVTTPFRRYRYLFAPFANNGKTPEVSVETYQNLFSDQWLHPICPSCGCEMTEIGICAVGAHAVCRECLQTCHICGKSVCRECGIDECPECHEPVCQDCSNLCHVCGKRFCTAHLLGCRDCRKHVCPQCSEQCEECGKIVGNIHIMECDISHKRVCFDCLVTCPCCDQHVAQSHSGTCAFCGQQICDECTFICDVCGETFCIHHSVECEISGKMICLQHSATCQSCSKRISVRLVRKCDVCRKPLCPECAVQCHDCEVYFCGTHAHDMATCPECGQTYCSLCYSGQGICEYCQEQQAREWL